MRSEIEKDLILVYPSSGENAAPSQDRITFLTSWDSAAAVRTNKKLARDVSTRIVIASNPAGQGLVLELQALPGSAGVC